MLRRLWRFAAPVAAIALLGMFSPTRADMVTPGGFIGAPSTIAGPTATLAASITNAPYQQTNAQHQVVGSGTYDAWVYSPDSANSGFTTIVFDVKVLAGDIGRITVSDFGNYTTDVYTDGSFSNTVGVSRSSDGTTLGFDFTDVNHQPTLLAGSSAGKFVIRTNSPNWGTGNISLIDTATANELSFAPVPLPSTANMGLALMACLGLGGLVRHFGLAKTDSV